MRPRVDIVLPCYNPPAGWQNSIHTFYEFIKDLYDVHFFIVDDGTKTENIGDTVSVISNRLPLRVISLQENSGKGFALRAGVKVTRAPFVLYTDIDLPFTPESICRIMDEITSSGCDIAAGTRDPAYYHGAMTAFRRRLSRAFRFFMKHAVRLGIDDTQCGLKAFNDRGRELFLQTRINRYLFDFEFIFRAVRTKGVRVKPVQVELRDNVVFSRMKWPVLLRETANLISVLVRR